MIDAEIRKRIRQDTPISCQEDVLTSNVFGLMRMLPDHLVKILSNAKHITNNEKLVQISTSSIASNSFELWKNFQNKNEKTDKHRDEPDVYFELENGKKIIIEVKYHSDESSENQLSDYARHCDYLIYLTFWTVHQTKAKVKYTYHPNIYLLRWEEFRQALEEEIAQTDCLVSSLLLQHIEKYLSYKIGSIWNGWSENIGKITYLYGGFYNGK
ncbi:MAG: hypothetical protein PHU41_09465 [Sulfuricurvum sp.]|nr:hypothetical protein [Sulfuricurvum sp.]